MTIRDFARQIIVGSGGPTIQRLPSPSDGGLHAAIQSLGITGLELINVLEEILINAREHGEGKGLEVYLGAVPGAFYYAVRDRGPGIHNAVPRNPKLADTRGKAPGAILRLACEEGITGTGQAGRGLGLHLLSEYCAAHDAECLLWSDSAQLIQQKDQIFGRKYASADGEIEGSLVCLRWTETPA